MRQLLSGIILILGVWLVISPWIMYYGLGLGQISALVAGALYIVLGLIGIVRGKTTAAFSPGDYTTFIIGLAVFVIGLIAIGADPCTRASDIVCGLLAMPISWIAAHLPSGERQTEIYSLQGQKMVEFKSIVNDKHGIGAKVILMGAMPQTVYFRPGELYNLLAQIPFKTIVAVGKELLTPGHPEESQKK